MVVVGHRGRGEFSSLLLGSVSQWIATRALSTVVVVRPSENKDGDVLVGADGSEPSRRALAWAAEEARQRDSRLRVVLAWSYLLPEGVHGLEPFRAGYTDADARRALRTIAEEVLGPDPGLEVKLEATCDLAARALIERADHAALLVVGPQKSSMHSRLDLGRSPRSCCTTPRAHWRSFDQSRNRVGDPCRTPLRDDRELHRGAGEAVLLGCALVALALGASLHLTGRASGGDAIWMATTIAGVLVSAWWVVEAARKGQLGVDVISVLASAPSS